MRAIELTRVPCDTRLFVADELVSEFEAAELLSHAQTLVDAPPACLTLSRDATGTSFEFEVDSSAILMSISARLEALLGFRNHLPETMRFRRYGDGESLGLHSDNYEIGGLPLVATAMLCLVGPEAGGETRFPYAGPVPIRVLPRPRRAVVWFNYNPDGSVDHSAIHEALAVRRGSKVTITQFIYAPLDHAAAPDLCFASEDEVQGIVREFGLPAPKGTE